MASNDAAQPITISEQDFVKQFRGEAEKPNGKLGPRIWFNEFKEANGGLAPSDEDIATGATEIPAVKKKYKIMRAGSPPPVGVPEAKDSGKPNMASRATTPISEQLLGKGKNFAGLIKGVDTAIMDKFAKGRQPTNAEKFVMTANEEGAGFIDSLQSPLGIVTLGFGPKIRALAKAGEYGFAAKALGWADKAVRGGFAGKQVVNAVDALSDFSDHPTAENAAKAIMSGAFAVGAMKPEIQAKFEKGKVATAPPEPVGPRSSVTIAKQLPPSSVIIAEGAQTPPDTSGTIKAPPSRQIAAAPPPGPTQPQVTPPSRQLPAAPRVFEREAPPDTSGTIKGWKPTILEKAKPGQPQVQHSEKVTATWNRVQQTLRDDPAAVQEYATQSPEQLQQSAQKMKYLKEAANKLPGELMPAPKGVTPQTKSQFVSRLNRHIQAVEDILTHFTPQDQSVPPPPAPVVPNKGR